MATTWVFERGAERLRLQRQEVLGQLRLVVWGTEMPDRVQVFEDELELVACMTALDSYLITAGWSLVDFFPERRSPLRAGAGRVDRSSPGAPPYGGPSHDLAGQAAGEPART